jgi:tetratricopeptide (TPR) repeat protein
VSIETEEQTESEPSLSDTLLPEDAAGWRALLTHIPPTRLLKTIRADVGLARVILQGFRAGPEVMKNPVVIGRIIEMAQRHPVFGRVLAADAALTSVTTEAEAELAAVVKTEKTTLPPEPREKDDSKLKEKLKELRSVIQAKEGQVTELQSQIVTLIRERDTARAEAETEKKARQSAEAAVERERRQRERESRRLEKPEKAEKTEKARPGLLPEPPVPTPVVPAAFEAAMRRLLNRGRYDAVVETCRELLAIAEDSAIERGLAHGLAAQALYGLGSNADGEEQDRLAVSTYLDAGLIPPAAEAFARLLAHSNASILRAPETALLTRLLALAQKLGQADEVQVIFGRLRVTAPSGYARLRRALSEGKKHTALLASLTTAAATSPSVGADETVALPVVGKTAATVTPRLLAQAVDRGDENFVTCARDGITTLRETNAALVDALLAAVATLQPLAVVPLTNELPRPAVVDASNVARYNPDPLAAYLASQPPPAVANLLAVRDQLLRRGFFPVLLIADANLRYHVDDRAAYLALLERGIVQEVSGGTSADMALLAEARNHAAPLVSNDRMTSWGEAARRVERMTFDIGPNGRATIVPI